MTVEILGACGKSSKDGVCFPNFEDDLCIGCPINGWELKEQEEDDEEDVYF